MSERVVLEVGRSSSRCGACRQGVLPNALTHDRITSWGDRGPGCGARFTHIRADWFGGATADEIDERMVEMRPDLTLIPSLRAAQEGHHAS